MFLILLFFIVAVERSNGSSCKTLNCSPVVGNQLACDLCHTCLDKGSRYCYTSDHKMCQCATHIPSECGNGPMNYTFCHLLDDFNVPVPEILQASPHSVTVVVPRFFQESPYDVIQPSFLYLLAIFKSNDTDCTSLNHIEMFKRNGGSCMIRVRVQMPKIDFTGQDNYYYDDRSPLESQFSREVFGDAENITFWAEVTVRKSERIPITNGTVTFTTILKSARVDFDWS